MSDPEHRRELMLMNGMSPADLVRRTDKLAPAAIVLPYAPKRCSSELVARWEPREQH